MKRIATTLIALFLLSVSIDASGYIECNGVVTVTKVEEVLKDDEIPTALIDIKVKAKHFICEGHDATGIPTGHLKRVRIALDGIIPKKYSKYFVSFSDGNGDGFFLIYNDFSFTPSINTAWKFIKKVQSTSYRPKGLKYAVLPNDYPLATNAFGSFDGKHTPMYPYVPSEGVDLYAIEKAWQTNKESKNESK